MDMAGHGMAGSLCSRAPEIIICVSLGNFVETQSCLIKTAGKIRDKVRRVRKMIRNLPHTPLRSVAMEDILAPTCLCNQAHLKPQREVLPLPQHHGHPRLLQRRVLETRSEKPLTRVVRAVSIAGRAGVVMRVRIRRSSRVLFITLNNKRANAAAFLVAVSAAPSSNTIIRQGTSDLRRDQPSSSKATRTRAHSLLQQTTRQSTIWTRSLTSMPFPCARAVPA